MGGILIATGLLSRKPGSGEAPTDWKESHWMDWIEPLRLMSLLRSGEFPADPECPEGKALLRACQESTELQASLKELFPAILPHIRAHGTTQISVMDGEGNEVSMTTSNGAGSAIILEGTGFMLNNMLGEEDLQPEGLNTWIPDQRLASMMAPTLARLDDGKRLATGSGASNRIRSTILQILRHVVDRNSSLEEAVNAPAYTGNPGSCTRKVTPLTQSAARFGTSRGK